MSNKIKSPQEILREIGASFLIIEGTVERYYVDTDENHIVNAMIVYAKQFIDLAAEEAETEVTLGNPYDYESAYSIVNKESILNIKQQIK